MRFCFISAAATLCLTCAMVLNGCSTVPTSGPSGSAIGKVSDAKKANGIQLVDVNDLIARRLAASSTHTVLAEELPSVRTSPDAIQAGDVIEITIWEAPPALLFNDTMSTSSSSGSTATAASHSTTLPEQTVSSDGRINIPFAGSVKVAGHTPAEVEHDIAIKLKGKANDPQVIVRRTLNASSYVTVIGEVDHSTRMPLTPHGERLLDAIAAAGGVRQTVSKMTIQVARQGVVKSIALDTVIRDPRQDIRLQPDDIITAVYQPLSFVALGATGRNSEVPFETTGISLAEALARSGGLADMRADPSAVFIFRFEDADALDWPVQPVRKTPEGRVPVVYRIDLRDPANLFVARDFAMHDKDILYASNAPLAEIQKFMNVVGSLTNPVVGAATIQNDTN
jgi:polysaccharide biosynthesis/export protein